MIIADASWVISLRDSADDHHQKAVETNAAIEEEVMALHQLTFSECLVGPARLGVLDDAASALLAAFEIVDPDDDSPIRWAALRASTGLRLPDAVVLDTALRQRARGIATFNRRLADRTRAAGLAVID